MTREIYLTSALSALGLVILLAANPALAGEDRDKVVLKVLVERTNTFCKEVLPAWFTSKQGMAEPLVKAVVADCYLGHARLAILGEDKGLPLGDTALTEVPAILLSQETGMNLDIYRPLAGRTIRIRDKK